MSERNEIPTEADALNWASDNVTYSSSDPGAPKRLVGFQPLNEPVPGPGEVIPAEDHNWLWKKCMEFLTWNKNGTTRQWRDLYDAIDAATVGDVFRIVIPLGSPPTMYARLTQLWKTTSTAGTVGDPFQVITDGEQIYYIAGSLNQSLLAAHLATGAEIWETSAGITQFACVAADGAWVYVQAAAPGEPGLHVRDRTDGSNDRTGGAEHNCTRLVANGAFVVGVNGTIGGPGSVTFWTPTTPTETGTVVPGAAAPVTVAIDSDQCYVGGTRDAGNDIFARTLSSRAVVWDVPIDGNDPSPINAICADGDFVYVGCDSFAVAAGGNRAIFCLDRFTGDVLWSLGGNDIDYLAVDDRYLYAVDNGNILYMIHLRGAEPGYLTAVANVGSVMPGSCDGISIVATDSATSTDFRRIMAGGASKEFMRAHGSDPNRRPFFTLAVPVDGRI